MGQFLFIDRFKTQPNKIGVYLSKNQLEKLKKVNLKTENINDKIRAFFFPPYTGAYVVVKGKKFTLIDDEILTYINSKLK